MRTILVDDELWALEQFELEAENISDIEIVGKFLRPLEALEFAHNNTVDFALLDISMPEMDGIELGKKLKEINPNIVIIYVTSYDSYLQEAFLGVKADYYILKPYNTTDVQEVFSRAMLLSSRLRKRVRFNTFGRFDMFVDDKVVRFSNAKAKELLALCVDRRGGTVTMDEAIDKLWENRLYDVQVKRLYRKAVIYLHALFIDYDAANVFESGRGVCNLNAKEVDCDYYEYLENNISHEFDGNYMVEYSWAEETNAELIFK